MDGSFPAVKAGDQANHRQADAEPAFRPIERAVVLRIELEDPRQELGTDAQPVVHDIDHGKPVASRDEEWIHGLDV